MKASIFWAAIVLAVSSVVQADEVNVDALYASWCLTGMAAELNGEKTPDRATYTFTKDSQIKYDAGFFKQEDEFTIEGLKIKTKAMGNYKMISVKEDEMILYYGGYMFFSRGACA